jgi:hypothetical protein
MEGFFAVDEMAIAISFDQPLPVLRVYQMEPPDSYTA